MEKRGKAFFLCISIILCLGHGIPALAVQTKTDGKQEASGQEKLFTAQESAWLQEKEELKVAVLHSWRPYIYKDTAGYSGFAIDLLNILKEESGISITYLEAENYAQLLQMLEDKEVDLAACAIQRKLQGGADNCFIPWLESPVQLISHKDSRLYVKTQLRAARITGTEFLDLSEYDNITVMDFETMEECLEAVRSRQVDFAICDLYTSAPLINRLLVHDLTVKNVTEHYVTMGFQTSPDEPEILSGILGKLKGTLTTAQVSDRVFMHGERTQGLKGIVNYVYKHPFELLCALASISFTMILLLCIYIRIRLRQQSQLKGYEESYRMMADTFGYAGMEYDFRRDRLILFGERHAEVDIPELVENLHEKLRNCELRITLTEKEFDRLLCRPEDSAQACETEFQCGMREGGWNWFRMIYIVVCTEESHRRPIRMVGCLLDTQKQHATEEKLVEIGQYDKLTGVYNRVGADGLIKNALEYLEEYSQNVFLLMDVDYFKRMNDNHGHLCGDDVLRAIGRSLKEIFEGDTIICRWGGDEFIMFVRGPGAEMEILKKRIEELRRRMKEYEYEGASYPVALSIGGIIPVRGMKLNELFQQADEVLYRVKKKGRDGFLIRRAAENGQEEVH